MSDAAASKKEFDREWTWMRVYYFEARKDDLILDGIWPSLDVACASHSRRSAYFQRDWSGGPNVLLGLRRCCRQDNPAVLMRRITEYLTVHPSASIIAEQEYEKRSRRLSQMENFEAMPLRSNNSVVFADEPVLALLKDENAKIDVRDYLTDSSEICIRWLERIRQGVVDRNHLTLQLLVALVWVVNSENLTPYLSLRSHAEGYLRLAARQGSELRNQFPTYYEAERGVAVRRAVDETLLMLESGKEIAPAMDAMLNLLRRTLTTLYSGVAAGRYKLESLLRTPLDDSPAFRSWQMTISLVYRTLNQLGVTALERFLICYLVARAIEDRCGRNQNPFWDWEKGPIDLSTCDRENVEKSFPYFYQGTPQ